MMNELVELFPKEEFHDVDYFSQMTIPFEARKVLLVSHNLTRTGAPLVLKDLAEVLIKNGQYPVLLSPVDGPLRDEFLQLGIPVIVRYKKGISSYKSKQFQDFFELIIVNTIIGADAIKELRYTSVPVLWWVHEGTSIVMDEVNKLPQKLTENISIYAVSDVVRRALDLVDLPYANVFLHGGVSDVSGHYKKDHSSSKYRFVLVGTLQRRKGQDILINALSQLPEEYQNRAEFFLIGLPFDSDVVDLVKEAENEYENVHYLGELSREEVMKWTASSDCLLSVSREDALSVTFVEGLMLSKPCICSLSNGGASFIVDGESGYLFDESSVEQLLQKMMFVIDHPEVAERTGRKGREIYNREFSLKRFESSVLSAIHETDRRAHSKENVLVNYLQALEIEKNNDFLLNRPRIYYDDGTGFSEEKLLQGDISIAKNHYEELVDLPPGIKRVRFDPAEGQACVLRNVRIKSNLGNQPFINVNGMSVGEYCVFDDADPQLLVDVEGLNITWILIRADIHTLDKEFLSLMSHFRKISTLEHELMVVRGEKINIENLKASLVAEIEKVETQLSQLREGYLTDIHEMREGYQKEIHHLNEDKNVLTRDLIKKDHELLATTNHYSEQIRTYEEKVDSLQRIEAERVSRINYLENIILSLQEQLVHKDQVIDEHKNSTLWKMTKPIRLTLDLTKKVLRSMKWGNLLLKGIISLKNEGIKGTARKISLYRERQKDIQKFLEETGVDLGSDQLSDYVAYDSEYQDNVDFSGSNTDVKMLAFYLPQFHTFPENDEWWGKGFTEWTNTRKATPRFEGHYQPREPHHNIGFYDLSDIETLRKQAALAKQHGIYGFCFYYYWFSGKRLMEKPVDMLLQHQDIDLPFCLCWANENWTRAWDGQSKEIIMKQCYDDKDPEQFIDDLKKYIDDKRYIRIHGKPLIIVYNPGEIPDVASTFHKWRERAREIGIGEVLIWTCQTANNTATNLNITSYVDAEVEFPPHNMWHDIIGVRNLDLKGKEAFIYNYKKLVLNLAHSLKNRKQEEALPIHRSCMLGWDNSARRENRWTTFYAYSLKSLYDWILLIMKEARRDFEPEERFVFINAWNEWAEGTYLEPDAKYGYANINTVSKALFDLPYEDRFKVINGGGDVKLSERLSNPQQVHIALQIHLFYTDTIEEIIRNLNLIPYPYDCYISTDTLAKEQYIRMMFQKLCTAKNVHVNVFPNRGRDVAPMLVQMAPVLDQYDYIGHIHSKKTKTADYGDDWRNYLYQHLFGSREYLIKLFGIFEQNKKLGIIFPETYPILQRMAEWGGNKDNCRWLLDTIGVSVDLPADPVFPVGNMFWARTDAIKAVFDYTFRFSDFPTEQGQTNATIAHAVERVWVYVSQAFGYSYMKTFNNCLPASIHKDSPKRIAFYVHYDKQNVISDDDVFLLTEISKQSDELIFITNSPLNDTELMKVQTITTGIIKRDNIGYDFGAWKEGLLSYGFEKLKEYDELLLLNNSCKGPYFDLQSVFNKMEGEQVDFWGLTLFPESADGSYIKKDRIPEHIQSYFQVFRKHVFTSKAFAQFWMEVKNHAELIDVIANCETQMTRHLSEAGFTYSAFIKESKLMSKYLNNYSVPYELPTSLLLLGNPLVKKKCKDYMSDTESNRLSDFCNQLGYKMLDF